MRQCRFVLNGVEVGRIWDYQYCHVEKVKNEYIYYFYKRGVMVLKIKEHGDLKLVFVGRRPQPYKQRMGE